MFYLVAINPIDHSCTHPTVQFYADAADLQDARDISQYLPFKDARTIVCYFLPKMTDDITTVRRFYPQAEEEPSYNNFETQVLMRLGIRAPHS